MAGFLNTETILVHKYFINDEINKLIRFMRLDDPLSMISRFIKYSNYGYKLEHNGIYKFFIGWEMLNDNDKIILMNQLLKYSIENNKLNEKNNTDIIDFNELEKSRPGIFKAIENITMRPTSEYMSGRLYENPKLGLLEKYAMLITTNLLKRTKTTYKGGIDLSKFDNEKEQFPNDSNIIDDDWAPF
jgi:hypothetical protein